MATVTERLQAIFPEEKAIPAELLNNLPLRQTRYLVGGELREWHGPLQEVSSPICVKKNDDCVPFALGAYPLLTSAEAKEALNAAVAAYGDGLGTWPTMSVAQRIAHVSDFVKRMQERRQDVVRLLMWEIAKTLPDAEKEFDRTVEYIQATVEALKELDRSASRFVLQEGFVAQIRRAPLGVVLCMGPYNYPLNETFTTLIPALIMGNTIIFKPPRIGVLLHEPLLEAFRDAFPPGVINTVYGDGREVVGPLMESGKVSVLAFIGSSRVADFLKKQHPVPHRLRCVLGLEAKNPAVVLPDADVDLAVKEAVLGTLSFNGQRCTALKILFVHEQIVETFLQRFKAGLAELPFGVPWEKGVKLTPLAETARVEYMQTVVGDAVERGALVINDHGGTSHHTFFYPAVVYPVNESMRLYQEEQFGPVIPVVPFSDIATPIQYLIQSHYGQQVSIFGSDPDQLARLIDPLVNQVCRVNINSQCQRGPDTFPFTGRKDSAEGTLSVSDALRVFSIRTLVAAKENDGNKRIISRIVVEHKSNFLNTDFLL